MMKEYEPQIICLNETKTDLEKLRLMRFDNKIPSGYAQYWNNSLKKGYAGSAVFTKVAPLKVDYNFGTHTIEGRTVTLEFKQFVLVSTYVPNSGDNLDRLSYRINEWDVDFHNYLKELENTRGKPVIITGDLNVAH